MRPYLTKQFDWNDYSTVSQYDELPLWSAPFGLFLLENIPLHNYKTYLDVGTGTGFPLIDISQRLGTECHAYGIDPWKAALQRAQEKINTLQLNNITLLEGSAEKMGFADNHFDFITSNLGINNFENKNVVLKECYRVLKPGAPFCITTNLTGQFSEFFKIFEQTLHEVNLHKNIIHKLTEHINHRGTVETHKILLTQNGFTIKKEVTRDFHLRYLNGTSFLNNSVIISGFLHSWKCLFKENTLESFFDSLESNLNSYSDQYGEFKVNVPMVYFECCKEC